MAGELERIEQLLRSIKLDRMVLGYLLPTQEAIRLNREAGFARTARTLSAIRQARITKKPSLVETEQIVLARITNAKDELKRLGVHI